jgi:putative ABC transport system substrate-binding protein
MKRRDFITLLSGAATWPFAAQAQEPGRIYRIGFLIPTPRDRPPVVAFFDELRLNGSLQALNYHCARFRPPLALCRSSE